MQIIENLKAGTRETSSSPKGDNTIYKLKGSKKGNFH